LFRRLNALAAVAALGLIGCGAAAHNRTSSTSAIEELREAEVTQATQASPAVPTGCTTHEADGNVFLSIYSASGAAGCESWDREEGRAGSYWKIAPEAPEMNPTCTVTRGVELAEVRGGGDSICAALVGQGWIESKGPGEEAEQAERKKRFEREHHEEVQREEHNREEEEVRRAREPREQAELEARSRCEGLQSEGKSC
jgi:hypothetical protein